MRRLRPATGVGRLLYRGAQRVANSAWGEPAARVGVVARGLVFLVLGYLVARIADGALGGVETSRPADGPGVAEAVAAQAGGRIALLVLALGMLLYALFSSLDAILHYNAESSSTKRWSERGLAVLGVVIYGGFGSYCLAIAASSQSRGQTSAGSDRQGAQWSAAVLGSPGGSLWLGLIGAILLVMAVSVVVHAARRSFGERLNRAAMSPAGWRAAMVLGSIGYLGRAGLFALVGWFTLRAAVDHDATRGQGLNGAVRLFANSARGPYLLWLLALALGAFGGYLFFESRYRPV